jgi:hypothetical protein
MTVASETMNELRRPPTHEQGPRGGIRLTEEQLRARRTRSIAIALALGAFVVVIFAVTVVRLGSNALAPPLYMRPVQPTQGTK